MHTDPATFATVWPDLVKLIPELLDLAGEVELADPDDWHAYEAWKRKLQSLVGMESPRYAELPTGAFDIALRHLLEVWKG